MATLPDGARRPAHHVAAVPRPAQLPARRPPRQAPRDRVGADPGGVHRHDARADRRLGAAGAGVGFDLRRARRHDVGARRRRARRYVPGHRERSYGGVKNATVCGTPSFGPTTPERGGPGWPLAKSMCLVPHLYTIGLAYGRNPLTGTPSPAGQWRIRNVITWARPNPPVGSLGQTQPGAAHRRLQVPARLLLHHRRLSGHRPLLRPRRGAGGYRHRNDRASTTPTATTRRAAATIGTAVTHEVDRPATPPVPRRWTGTPTTSTATGCGNSPPPPTPAPTTPPTRSPCHGASCSPCARTGLHASAGGRRNGLVNQRRHTRISWVRRSGMPTSSRRTSRNRARRATRHMRSQRTTAE